MDFDLPWHPLIVHLPLGIGLAVPIVAIVALLAARRRGGLERRDWLPVVTLQALVLAGAFGALRTGEAEEDRVAKLVGKDAVHHHEEQAEVFVWLAGISLAVGVVTLVVSGPRRATCALASTVMATIAASATVWVGHSGGELVYRHGAAAAYAPDPSGLPSERRER